MRGEKRLVFLNYIYIHKSAFIYNKNFKSFSNLIYKVNTIKYLYCYIGTVNINRKEVLFLTAKLHQNKIGESLIMKQIKNTW